MELQKLQTFRIQFVWGAVVFWPRHLFMYKLRHKFKFQPRRPDENHNDTNMTPLIWRWYYYGQTKLFSKPVVINSDKSEERDYSMHVGVYWNVVFDFSIYVADTNPDARITIPPLDDIDQTNHLKQTNILVFLTPSNVCFCAINKDHKAFISHKIPKLACREPFRCLLVWNFHFL